MVPYDDKSPFVTSGIRIGTPAVTTRGLKEDDMDKVADFIDRALMNASNEEALEKLRVQVNEFMSVFPLFAGE